MKKSIAILIISLFLSPAFSQTGFADSRGFTVSNDLTFFQHWGNSPSLSAFLLFDDKDFGLVHFPFAQAVHTTAFQDLTAFFPFIEAVLSAKDLLWTEIAKWNPSPSFSVSQRYDGVLETSRGTLDSNNLTAEDHMGISLNHGIGKEKVWNVSLDLGIAFENYQTIGPNHIISHGPFPKLGMDIGDQREDVFDQLRNATPLIGVGISCKF